MPDNPAGRVTARPQTPVGRGSESIGQTLELMRRQAEEKRNTERGRRVPAGEAGGARTSATKVGAQPTPPAKPMLPKATGTPATRPAGLRGPKRPAQGLLGRLRQKFAAPLAFTAALGAAQQADRAAAERPAISDAREESLAREGSVGRPPIETMPKTYAMPEAAETREGYAEEDLQKMRTIRQREEEMRRAQEQLLPTPAAPEREAGAPSEVPLRGARTPAAEEAVTAEQVVRVQRLAMVQQQAALRQEAVATKEQQAAAFLASEEENRKAEQKRLKLIYRFINGTNIITGLADFFGLIMAFIVLNLMLLNKLSFKSDLLPETEFPLEDGCILLVNCCVCLTCTFLLAGIILLVAAGKAACGSIIGWFIC